MMRVLRVQPSEPQAKLPLSRRRALYLWLPPRVRTVWTRLAPILVLAAWRPASKARFFPVDRGQNVCFLVPRREQKAIRAFGSISCMGRRTVVGALGAGGGPLVAGVARDTHDCCVCWRREVVSRAIPFLEMQIFAERGEGIMQSGQRLPPSNSTRGKETTLFPWAYEPGRSHQNGNRMSLGGGWCCRWAVVWEGKKSRDGTSFQKS